jgi:HPt (histidine-containing phosphotransfer) domain-containing protein
MRDDPDMREILGEFVKSLPEQVERMLSLLREQNLEELRRVVHQLKGAGGGYGFDRITTLAAAAEARLKAGESLDTVTRSVEELIALTRTVAGYERGAETAADASC